MLANDASFSSFEQNTVAVLYDSEIGSIDIYRSRWQVANNRRKSISTVKKRTHV
jgi:hypothetical protein